MLAALTPLPVIGVPVPLAQLDGMDSLLSIVQMPPGIPVAAVSIGGAKNAGLLAVRILAAGADDDAVDPPVRSPACSAETRHAALRTRWQRPVPDRGPEGRGGVGIQQHG